MLVDKTRRIVHLIVDDDEQILLRRVLRHVRVREVLVGHCVSFAVLSRSALIRGMGRVVSLNKVV